MSNIRCVAFVLLFFFIFILKATIVTASEIEAQKVLERFLTGEFNGNGSTRDNVDIVRYNPKLQSEYDDRIGGASIYLIYDNLIIIDGYEVSTVDCNKKTCSATVSFNQLSKAVITNNIRTIIKDQRKGVAKYVIKKIKNKWYVYDPPTMMISIAALIKHYESQVRLESSIDITNDKDNARKKLFQKNISDLQLLKSL